VIHRTAGKQLHTVCDENQSESHGPEIGTSEPAQIGLSARRAIQLVEIGLGS